METKRLLTDALHDMLDLCEEINWTDDTLSDIFDEEISNKATALYKVLYAINGYQCWNGTK